MFRAMRREKKLMPGEAVEQVLREQTHGVLACLGDHGYPYAVPLSYVYYQGRLYFHSALVGHKLDAISQEPKVSFCVVSRDEVDAAEVTTAFTSVIAFGQARVVTDQAEADQAAQALLAKYCGGLDEENTRYLANHQGKFLMVALDIQHITGKATPA